MSRIRAKDTKPEILVRKFLHSKGFRFRLHDRKLPGKPDVVFPRLQKVIFIHGCFWHGHKGCKYFVVPQSRTKWWIDKIEGNKARDSTQKKGLVKLGWKVLTVFECQLKPRKRVKAFERVLRFLGSTH